MTPPFSKARTEVVSSAKSSRLRGLSEGRAPVTTTRASCATALGWGDCGALAEGEPLERPMSTAEATQSVPCALGAWATHHWIRKCGGREEPSTRRFERQLIFAGRAAAGHSTNVLADGQSASNVLGLDYRGRRTANSEIAKPRAAPRKTSEGKWDWVVTREKLMREAAP